MQIRSITVNAAGLAAGTDMQGNSINGKQVSNGGAKQTQSSGFGPECRVTISQEGRNISRQQASQAEKSAQGTVSVKEERMLLRQDEEARRSKEIREGYREKLNEIDKTISDLNASYPEPKKRKPEDTKDPYDAKMMDEAMKNRLDLREAMYSQKDFQAQESQRLAKEAQQMAMQSAKYKQEVDDNNRDLLTLLKTMEEAEKAEEERENGGVKAGGDSVNASGAQASTGGILKASATQFMTSAINQEWDVEQMLAGFKGDGNWFLGTADSITQNMLQKTAAIKAALDDETVTDEQLAEMMENIQDGLADNYENVENYRGWGLHVLRLAREDKIQHLADDPLKGMQDTKKSVHQATVSAALGEARQSGLDKASQEIADEVKKLLDERNDVDRAPQEKEEDEEEQVEKEENEEELNQMQEEWLQLRGQDRGAI